MTAQNLFGSLSLEETQLAVKAAIDQLNFTNAQIVTLSEQINALSETMLLFVTEVLKALPRKDTADRMTVRMETWDGAASANVGTLGGTFVTNMIPFQISQMGALHVYDKIQVSS